MVEQHDPRVQRVIDAGARTGVEVRAQRFPEGTHTAEDAARAIGCTLAQIVKTLVFVDGDGEPVAFLVSGANRLDPAKGAAAAGIAELRKADARATRSEPASRSAASPRSGTTARFRCTSTRTCSRSTRSGLRPGCPTRSSRSPPTTCCAPRVREPRI